MTTETINDLAGLDTAALTPVMRQYFAAKQQYPDCLMFCRIGDFYELFYDDAILVARELQLTLTARDREKKQPMCGVPYHAAEIYLQRLLRKGYRIALCEQMEDPKQVKTIVRREVTRVLTPGTSIDPSLGPEQSNYLASMALSGTGGSTRVGLAVIDLSTGEFRATEFVGATSLPLAIDELGRIRPVELIHASGLFGPTSGGLLTRNGESEEETAGLEAIRTRTPIEEWVFTGDYAVPLLTNHLHVHSLDGIGLGGHEAAATAAGALLHYMRATKQGALEHIDGIRFYERSTCLELDSVSVRNLELVEPLFSGESVQTTLFHTLDACCTPMGKRLLRTTLLRPSNDLAEIDARLDAVAEAVSDLRKREGLRRSMDGVLDLERLLARVALDSAGPREVMSLAATLGCLPILLSAMESFEAARWRGLALSIDKLEDLHKAITMTIADEPPITFADGGVIRAGVDAELDELRELSRSGRQALIAIEERERQRTGIGSLKVRLQQRLRLLP